MPPHEQPQLIQVSGTTTAYANPNGYAIWRHAVSDDDEPDEHESGRNESAKSGHSGSAATVAVAAVPIAAISAAAPTSRGGDARR